MPGRLSGIILSGALFAVSSQWEPGSNFIPLYTLRTYTWTHTNATSGAPDYTITRKIDLDPSQPYDQLTTGDPDDTIFDITWGDGTQDFTVTQEATGEQQYIGGQSTPDAVYNVFDFPYSNGNLHQDLVEYNTGRPETDFLLFGDGFITGLICDLVFSFFLYPLNLARRSLNVFTQTRRTTP